MNHPNGRDMEDDLLPRRTFLYRAMRGASLPFIGAGSRSFAAATQDSAATAQKPRAVLSAEDDAFLEELERANFQYFWDQADPQSGLTKDRCRARTGDDGVVASIAATGFGLTALCIGEKRGYVS